LHRARLIKAGEDITRFGTHVSKEVIEDEARLSLLIGKDQFLSSFNLRRTEYSKEIADYAGVSIESIATTSAEARAKLLEAPKVLNKLTSFEFDKNRKQSLDRILSFGGEDYNAGTNILDLVAANITGYKRTSDYVDFMKYKHKSLSIYEDLQNRYRVDLTDVVASNKYKKDLNLPSFRYGSKPGEEIELSLEDIEQIGSLSIDKENILLYLLLI
jgi:hypothetical protein